MEDAIVDLQSKGIKVGFINVHGQPMTLLNRFNLIPGFILTIGGLEYSEGNC